MAIEHHTQVHPLSTTTAAEGAVQAALAACTEKIHLTVVKKITQGINPVLAGFTAAGVVVREQALAEVMAQQGVYGLSGVWVLMEQHVASRTRTAPKNSL